MYYCNHSVPVGPFCSVMGLTTIGDRFPEFMLTCGLCGCGFPPHRFYNFLLLTLFVLRYDNKRESDAMCLYTQPWRPPTCSQLCNWILYNDSLMPLPLTPLLCLAARVCMFCVLTDACTVLYWIFWRAVALCIFLHCGQLYFMEPPLPPPPPPLNCLCPAPTVDWDGSSLLVQTIVEYCLMARCIGYFVMVRLDQWYSWNVHFALYSEMR